MGASWRVERLKSAQTEGKQGERSADSAERPETADDELRPAELRLSSLASQPDVAHPQGRKRNQALHIEVRRRVSSFGPKQEETPKGTSTPSSTEKGVGDESTTVRGTRS